jgi:hypothetical protein
VPLFPAEPDAARTRRSRVRTEITVFDVYRKQNLRSMTELEEQGLTPGEGKALSGHRSDRAYSGYAKLTQERALAATRKRHAYRLSEEQNGPIFRNEPAESFRNDGEENESELA